MPPPSHPLSQFLSTFPAGQEYVREFDPTLRQWAAEAPVRQIGLMSQARSEEAEEARLADLAWANAPAGARLPVAPSQFEDPSAGVKQAASFLPGAAIADVAFQKLGGEVPSTSDYLFAGLEGVPGGKYIPLLAGSLFGTGKRYLFHGGASRSRPVEETGAPLVGAGSEINTPGSSYSTRPSVAAGFVKVGAQDPADIPTNRMSFYEIKDPETVRNLPPDEYLDLYTGFGGGGFPTPDIDPMKNVQLYSYPNIGSGHGYTESEIAAIRNITPEAQDKIDEFIDIDPGSRESIALRTAYHDPALSQARYQKSVTEQGIRDMKEIGQKAAAVRRFANTYGQGASAGQMTDFELRGAMKDMHDLLSSGAAGRESQVQNSINRFIEFLGPKISGREGFADAVSALEGYRDATKNAIRADTSYFSEASAYGPEITDEMRKDIRRAHGMVSLAQINAANELRKVMGATGIQGRSRNVEVF